jgi:hypothetical protein
MTSLPPGARSLVQSARGSLNPTPTDQQSVATRLAAALGPSALGEMNAAPHRTTPSNVSLPQRALPNINQSSAAGWLRSVGFVSLGLVAGGVSGYHFGLSRGEQRLVNAAPAVTSEPAEVSSAESAPAETGHLNPLPEDPIAEPEDDIVRPPTPKVANGNRSRATLRETPAATSPSSDDEVYQVQRIERALRQGDAPLALSLLQELHNTSPRGRLHQERSAARCIAHCMLNHPASDGELQRFEQQYPNSVHLNRLRAACAKK